MMPPVFPRGPRSQQGRAETHLCKIHAAGYECDALTACGERRKPQEFFRDATPFTASNKEDPCEKAQSCRKENWTSSLNFVKWKWNTALSTRPRKGAPYDFDEPKSRLRAPDPLLPRPEARGRLCPGDR